MPGVRTGISGWFPGLRAFLVLHGWVRPACWPALSWVGPWMPKASPLRSSGPSSCWSSRTRPSALQIFRSQDWKGHRSFPRAPGAGGASRAAFSAATLAGGQGTVLSPALSPPRCLSFLNPAPISTPHKHPCFSVCARPVLGSGDTAGSGCPWAPAPSRALAGGMEETSCPRQGGALGPGWRAPLTPDPCTGGPRVVSSCWRPSSTGRPSTGSARGQGTPAPRPQGPLPACLPQPPGSPLLPGSACSPPGAGAAVARQAQPGRPLLGAVRGGVRAGRFCASGQSPLPSSTPHGPSLLQQPPGPAWAAGTGRRGLHERVRATITIRANAVLQSQDA